MHYSAICPYQEFEQSIKNQLDFELRILHTYHTKSSESIKFIINNRLILLKDRSYYTEYDRLSYDMIEYSEMILQDNIYRTDPDLYIQEMSARIFSACKNQMAGKYENEEILPNWCTFGCFSYEPIVNIQGSIFLHIGNTTLPDSFLNHRDLIYKSLLELMDNAETHHKSHTLVTDTWLNSYDKWLNLFPDVWKSSLEDSSPLISGHLGYWGQFIDRRGLFKQKAADEFNRINRLPYPVRRSVCSFTELRKHINALI